MRVLDAACEFDEFGGTSLGLAAWEFHVSEESLAPAFAELITQAALYGAGKDENDDQNMWRLTAIGNEIWSAGTPTG